jgi:CDP-diacylglycerol pyrophosphatase
MLLIALNPYLILMRNNLRRIVRTAICSTLSLWLGVASANPDALWNIVSQSCVPAAEHANGTGKCTRVDLSTHYALLKDIDGPAQYLLIPTDRIQGIESPSLLNEDAPNYWSAAWNARTLVSDRLPSPLPDDAVGLEINSASRRSQQQLHIHIDCIQRTVLPILERHRDDTPDTWVQETIAGEQYRIMRVRGPEFDFNPFRIVARDRQGSEAMGKQTIFVTGTPTAGFLILNSSTDMTGGTGSAEGLLDHTCGMPPKG